MFCRRENPEDNNTFFLNFPRIPCLGKSVHVPSAGRGQRRSYGSQRRQDSCCACVRNSTMPNHARQDALVGGDRYPCSWMNAFTLRLPAQGHHSILCAVASSSGAHPCPASRPRFSERTRLSSVARRASRQESDPARPIVPLRCFVRMREPAPSHTVFRTVIKREIPSWWAVPLCAQYVQRRGS